VPTRKQLRFICPFKLLLLPELSLPSSAIRALSSSQGENDRAVSSLFPQLPKPFGKAMLLVVKRPSIDFGGRGKSKWPESTPFSSLHNRNTLLFTTVDVRGGKITRWQAAPKHQQRPNSSGGGDSRCHVKRFSEQQPLTTPPPPPPPSF
jgi:hypothetical protein